ncbi:MAG: hypothetical protein PVF43_08195 [Candidatus Eiseniibacteriota bacterium]
MQEPKRSLVVLIVVGCGLACGAGSGAWRTGETAAPDGEVPLDPIDRAWDVSLETPLSPRPPGYQVPYRRHNLGPSTTLFEKYARNPVLRIGTEHGYDSGHSEYPCVVEVGDSLWAYYAAFGAGGHWAIAAAHSRDGIHWTKAGVVLEPDSTAGAWDGATNAFPSVMYVPEAAPDERFRLYYAGKSGALYEGIGLALSADGIHFVRHGRVLSPGGAQEWDGTQIVDPSVLRVGDGYRMYYCGSRTREGLFRVGVALSVDGVQWVKYPDNPVYAIGPERGRGIYTVDVVQGSEGFLLFESTPDSEGFYDIYAVASENGLAFDPTWRRLVLTASHDGTWDHVMVYGMDVLVRHGRVFMWFNGIHRKMVTRGGQIGLARTGLAALERYLRREGGVRGGQR